MKLRKMNIHELKHFDPETKATSHMFDQLADNIPLAKYQTRSWKTEPPAKLIRADQSQTKSKPSQIEFCRH